jgi:hypothetical protein
MDKDQIVIIVNINSFVTLLLKALLHEARYNLQFVNLILTSSLATKVQLATHSPSKENVV